MTLEFFNFFSVPIPAALSRGVCGLGVFPLPRHSHSSEWQGGREDGGGGASVGLPWGLATRPVLSPCPVRAQERAALKVFGTLQAPAPGWVARLSPSSTTFQTPTLLFPGPSHRL